MCQSYARSFAYIFSAFSYKIGRYTHFMDKETEAQEGR